MLLFLQIKIALVMKVVYVSKRVYTQEDRGTKKLESKENRL